MRPQIQLLVLALNFIPAVIAIFADDAYRIDYHRQLLGLPQQHTTFFHRPRKDGKASLLYTLSDQGVIGAVNPGSGAIVWRQFLSARTNGTLSGSTQGYLRGAEGEPTVVSAMGGYIHAWDAATGREQWYNEFEGWTRGLEVMETAGDEAQKDVLVLFQQASKSILRRLHGANGNVIWERAIEATDLPFQVSTNVGNVYVVSLHGPRGGYNLRITTLDPATGKKIDENVLASKADVQKVEDVLFVGANTAAPIVVWTDKAKKTLKVHILGTKQVHSLTPSIASEEVEKIIIHAPRLIQAQPHFLVHSQSSSSHWADVYHVDNVAGTVSEAYHLPKLPGKGAFSTSSQDGNVYFTRHSEDEITITSSIFHGILGRYPIRAEKGLGSAVYGVSEVVFKSESSYAVRSAVVSTEDNWDMIRNGVLAWRREEGITGAVAAAWADVPEGEELAKTLEAEAHSNPLSAYVHRVSRHLRDLQYLPEYLQNIPKRLLSSIVPIDTSEDTSIVRDSFGFRKLIVLATERGRLYGLDIGNQGKIVWTRKAFDMVAGEKWDVKGIFVDNVRNVATIHGNEGGYIVVNIDTGANIETLPQSSSSPVQSTALVDSPSGRWLLPIGPGGKPGPIPKALAPKSRLVVRGENGEVKGLAFHVQGDQVVPTETWSFQPPAGQRILSVTSRPPHDPVASIGRVLSDRTVLYKFLNPNTVLVTSASDGTSSMFLYLLDSVSGAILYSTVHEFIDITKPIALALTENWFAYSFWSDTPAGSDLTSSKGYQLVVSELYESNIPNDRGLLGTAKNFSSLLPSDDPSSEPSPPFVVTQAFVIPEAISHMAVSQTRQGITSRLLLCALPASNAIVGIPRTLLDPRRPVGRDPTPGEVEEGLMRYSPQIEFDPKMIITHRREEVGIRNIVTAPALLESTSLVFAFGIDIFGTRVTPSMAFDILGNDFNRLALIGTVSGLAALVGFLAPMVRKKQINAQWSS